MATITGLSASRMLEIEGASVVGGEIIGGDLILQKHDGSSVNAGSVIGPVGPEGPAGDVSTLDLSTAIDALESDVNDQFSQTGLGVMDMNTVTSDQIWAGFLEGTWQNITGGTLSFEPVVGRLYEFSLGLTMESYEADVDLHVLLDDDTGPELFRMSGYTKTANRMTGMHASRIVQAPIGWVGTKTFTAKAWFATDFEVRIKSGTYPLTISVKDVGLPPA